MSKPALLPVRWKQYLNVLFLLYQGIIGFPEPETVSETRNGFWLVRILPVLVRYHFRL
jgi:hypothetical protein